MPCQYPWEQPAFSCRREAANAIETVYVVRSTLLPFHDELIPLINLEGENMGCLSGRKQCKTPTHTPTEMLTVSKSNVLTHTLAPVFG